MELFLAENAEMQFRFPFPSRTMKYKSETNGRWVVDCCPRFVLRDSATAKPISQAAMLKIEKLTGYVSTSKKHVKR